MDTAIFPFPVVFLLLIHLSTAKAAARVTPFISGTAILRRLNAYCIPPACFQMTGNQLHWPQG